MNNIFTYATGELSQDAFICWLFNWFNEGTNKALKGLVINFCREKLGILEVESIDIHRQFSRKQPSVKIDVLLVINSIIAVVIEDKTYTSEHGNQIQRYKDGINELLKQDKNNKLVIDGKEYTITEIKTVYWKTGFHYNCDKRVKADVKVDSEYLINILETYRHENEIIDMYVQSLLDNRQDDFERERYWEKDKRYSKEKEENRWHTNICNSHVSQYKLMREFFPEKEFWKGNDLYYVYHGSSSGRPWTEMNVYHCDREDSQEMKRFYIFWRIDTSNKGSYISLRLYKMEKGSWDDRYKNFKQEVQRFIETDGTFAWSDIDPGKTDSYKEADIAHFSLNDIWEARCEQIKNVVRRLNYEIVEYATKIYGPNRYEE